MDLPQELSKLMKEGRRLAVWPEKAEDWPELSAVRRSRSQFRYYRALDGPVIGSPLRAAAFAPSRLREREQGSVIPPSSGIER
jgi:hypothetical protein